MEKSVLGRLLLLVMGVAWTAQGLVADVKLKNRQGETRLGNRMSVAKNRQGASGHLILDLGEAPTAQTRTRLAARGLRVVAYLPPTGVMVGFQGSPDLDGLNLEGFDALQPADKISNEIAQNFEGDRRGRAIIGKAYFVVEFHSDVPWEDRRAIVTESGLEVRDHQDLVGDHMLVRGSVADARALAEWDEVAYIFPASGELATGLPLVGCLGGATDVGQVGQMTQRVGEGWDGPGLNAAELTYSFQATTGRLGADEAQAEIQRAMSLWSRAARLTFRRTTSFSAPRNINILFGSRDHGDPYPFDGPGRVLAHTFYPAPPNPEPIAGDLHFDSDEPWNIGSDIDVFSVALHELGHALGLGHSDVPNAVMYPYYRRAEALTPEDVGAIQLMYAAAPGGAVDPLPSPPPMKVSITSPGASAITRDSSINVSGTITGGTGTPSLTWETSRGERGKGTLSGNSEAGWQWMATIPLLIGDNPFTVMAMDGAGQTESRSGWVERLASPTTSVPAAPAPAPPPQIPLKVDLVAPGADSVVTRSTLAAAGIVSGAIGRPSVRWASDRGFEGTAVISQLEDGSFRWTADPIALQPGANGITVTATDSANRTSSRTLRATYSSPPDPGSKTDEAPPRLTISSPSTSFLMTQAYSIAVRGTASDQGRIAEVRWECSCGSRGVAQGTTQWTIPNIPLPLGSFIVRVVAKDMAGNEGMASFTVYRYEN